ncbi:MAG: HAD-IIB family hydrolase [Lachnospiraceae bacterium]|nr:HAD-IIB family hydrolase [Lachnospiraceae bacterium]
MKNIKAIITDLDRTLLRTDKSLSEYTIAVLRDCKARGIKIMAATARPERTITEYDEAIGFDAVTVMNGAKVMVGEKRMTYGIPDALAEEMLAKVCERKEFLFSVETGEILYAAEHIAEFQYTLHTEFPKLPAGETAYKILVSGEGAAEFVKENLTEDLHCTVANGYLVQIMSKDAKKRNGVAVMLDAFGISPEEAVYFGDDQDDAESMEFCGLGIAVDNAIPEVKAVADKVVESNDADGVARWIEDHILKN